MGLRARAETAEAQLKEDFETFQAEIVEEEEARQRQVEEDARRQLEEERADKLEGKEEEKEKEDGKEKVKKEKEPKTKKNDANAGQRQSRCNFLAVSIALIVMILLWA